MRRCDYLIVFSIYIFLMKAVEWLECMGTIQVFISLISINSFRPQSKPYDVNITMISHFMDEQMEA